MICAHCVFCLCLLFYAGERRAQLRSPALQGYIRNTHDRAAQGAIATAASRYEDKNGRQPASRDRKNSF